MRPLGAVMVLLLAGCATAPISYLAPVPDGDAYSCAMREFNRLGFAIANADRGAGFITGEKQTSGMATAILAGATTFDQITVAIFEDGDGGQTMRVTAGSTSQSLMGFTAGAKTPNAPSNSAKSAAQAILEVCADGPIRQQSLDTGAVQYLAIL